MSRNFSINSLVSIVSMKPVNPVTTNHDRNFREYWIEPDGKRWITTYIEPYDIMRRRVASTHMFKFTARWKVKYMMWAERRLHTEGRRRWSQVECYRHPEDR